VRGAGEKLGDELEKGTVNQEVLYRVRAGNGLKLRGAPLLTPHREAL